MDRQGKRTATMVWLTVAFLVVTAGVLALNVVNRYRQVAPDFSVVRNSVTATGRRPAVSSQSLPISREFSPAFLQMAFGDNPPLLEQIKETLAQVTNVAPVPIQQQVTIPVPNPPVPERRAVLATRYAKHFTREEAESLIPAVRQIFSDARACRARLEDAQNALTRQAGGHIGFAPSGPKVDTMLRNLAVMKSYVGQLESLGVVVEDMDRGVVSFPSLRDGREVLLCWEVTEDGIGFWHSLDSSYASRERL